MSTPQEIKAIHVDIDHIAKLARLALDPAEKSKLASQLDSIAGFMAEIHEVDTSVAAMAASEHRNIFVPDSATEESGTKTRVLVDSSPQHTGDFVTVPQVITAGKHS